MAYIQIKYDELDWEDACVPYGAIYKGLKFTGTAINEIGGSYEEFSFQNGLLHGRTYLLDKAKKLIREEFYENGVPVNEHIRWIGEQKHTKLYNQGELTAAKTEDYNGALVFEYNRKNKSLLEWFTNGNKLSEKFVISTDNLHQFASEKYWAENGVWLMTIRDKVFHEFNQAYLMEHSFALNSEVEERIFILFSEHLLKEQIETGIKYLQVNTSHKNPFFRYQSARLLSRTNDLRSIAFLENLLEDHLQPETKLSIDWQGFGHSRKTEHPISKMAQIAIEIIRNPKGS